MKKKKLLLFSLLSLLLLGTFVGVYRVEASINTIGKVEDIGTYDENSFSHVGAVIRLNGKVKYYALDSWSKEDSGWSYIGSNDNGLPAKTNTPYTSSGGKTFRLISPSTGYRIAIDRAALLEEMPADISIVSKYYHLGELCNKTTEYSFEEKKDEFVSRFLHSTMQTISASAYTAEAASVFYDFYTPITFEDDKNFEIKLPKGAEYSNAGKLYVMDSGYYVKELPTLKYQKPGYETTFLGWYDKEDGGNKLSAGSIVPENANIYPRWEETPVYRNVTFIDMVSTGNHAGKTLGMTSKQRILASTVSGEEIGTDAAVGAYYQGYVYTNATEEIVKESGTTVYRYFKPHSYTIRFHGNGNTGGEMADLENCAYGDSVTLRQNAFRKDIPVHLNPNGDNAVCRTSEIYAEKKFLGWSLSPNGAMMYANQATVSDLTDSDETVDLYALWGDEKITIDVTPEKMGYGFAGWSENATDTQGKLQFTINEETELFAIWNASIVNYHVEFYKENSDGTYTLDGNYAYNGYSDEEVTLREEDMTHFPGYEFDEEHSVTNGVIKADGSLVLSLYYKRTGYELSYDRNGGTSTGEFPKSAYKKFGEEITLPDIPEVVKEGYVAVGWGVNSRTGNGIVYSGGDKLRMPETNTIVYIVWEPVSYQLVLDANISSGTGERKEVALDYEEEYTIDSADFTREGFMLRGFSTSKDSNEASYLVGDIISGMAKEAGEVITLYAVWEPLKMEINYDMNISEAMAVTGTGIVPNTLYQYDKESFSSSLIYYAQGYEMTGWNTKADGSGKTIKPGEAITGLLATERENVLYAVWKPNQNTKFTVTIQENGKTLEVLTLHGVTGENIGTAIERSYQKTLGEDDVYAFYPGYEVVNKDCFKTVIAPDGGTNVICQVAARSCKVEFMIYDSGEYKAVYSENVAYGHMYTLPENIEQGMLKAEQYRDSKNTVYQPGSKVTLQSNKTFYIMHTVILHYEISGMEDVVLKVDHGKKAELPVPEKKGYKLLGWQDKNGSLITGASSEAIKSSVELSAKWSEPLTYKITYDIDSYFLRIAENRVDTYQFGKGAVLPTEKQVIVAEGYQFAGWYMADDAFQSIIKEIPKDYAGDVSLKAKLVPVSKDESEKKDEKDSKEETQDTNNETKENGEQSAGNGEGDRQEDVSENHANEEQTSGTGNPESGQTEQNNSTNSSTDSFDDVKKNAVQEDEDPIYHAVFEVKRMIYQVSSEKKRTVVLTGNHSKNSSIKIGGTVSYQGKKYRVASIGKKAFYGNGKIKKITITDSVLSVKNSAFSKMKKLQSVVLGKKVQTIDTKAFYGDKKLKKITIRSNNLKTVGSKAFLGLNKKAVIQIPKKKIASYKKMIRKHSGKIKA